jgi:hypothetical protein
MLGNCNVLKIKYTSNQHLTQNFHKLLRPTTDNNKKMAAQEIVKYSFQESFSLSKVQFEKAFTIDHNKAQNTYAIYWIQEGKGTYIFEIVNNNVGHNVGFVLAPKAAVKAHIKSAYV